MEEKDQKKNIIWHSQTITREERELFHGHKSLMVWFTGLSGSGKSTIANALQNELFKKGVNVYVLDGDNLRHGLNSNLQFSPEDRKENIRRTAEAGKLLADAGIVVLSALISPFKQDRELARSILGEEQFVEVYIKCPIEECEKRDPKGLYKKARKGEIPLFTGIDQAYEEPVRSEIILDTSQLSIEECAAILLTDLEKRLSLQQNKKEEGL
ncbi:adenylyl-sulfate kinase [Cytobacillus firmus]|uniref:adenylyl-sulfate kinase n=1 Tax=Cytobacillus firmus TaxID=1399 RepID=UPI002FFF10CE